MDSYEIHNRVPFIIMQSKAKSRAMGCQEADETIDGMHSANYSEQNNKTKKWKNLLCNRKNGRQKSILATRALLRQGSYSRK